MIANKTFADLFDKLQVMENNMVSIQGPLKTGYSRETFWNKVISKEPVIKYDSQTIATATKNMIAGIFNKEDNAQIINLVLKLAFYVVDGDDACFIYENIVSFEDSNSSPKVMCANTRRKVSLVCNGWFEKWSKIQPASLGGETQDLIRYLQQPSNDECISYWGPWLATILLKLENSSYDSMDRGIVGNNITTLFSKLYRQYQGLGFNFPAMNTALWRGIPNIVRITDLDEQKRNYLYWAMINVYHDEKTSKTVIDLLNFTIIPSLRFKNMELITLIDQFKKRVGCGQIGALLSSLSVGTLRSWENYIKMTETYLNPKHVLGRDKCWPYSREFDSSVFMDMSYEENYKLCNILAMIIDLHENNWLSYNEIHRASTYWRISRNCYINKLDKEDFELCKHIASLLKEKERELAVNPTVSAKMLTM